MPPLNVMAIVEAPEFRVLYILVVTFAGATNPTTAESTSGKEVTQSPILAIYSHDQNQYVLNQSGDVTRTYLVRYAVRFPSMNVGVTSWRRIKNSDGKRSAMEVYWLKE